MTNKVNLLFDGNNFSFRSISVYPGIRGNKLFQIDKEREDFIQILANNFITEINKFKNVINKIIVTVDSRSWRYQIYPDYKGDRKRDSSVDWKNYSILVDEFYNILSEKGIIITRSFGAEGDDLIYKWAKHLNSVGENVIIMSMDRDLSQLTNIDNGVFTVQYDSNKRSKGFFATNDFYDFLDDVKNTNSKINDIFSINDLITKKEEIGDDLKQVINNILKHTPRNIVDTDLFVLEKVLTGDRGDYIFSPYTYIRGNKRMGIGEKGAEKIIASYNYKKKFEIRDLFNSDKINLLSDLVIKSMKLPNDKITKVKDGLDLNTRLMLLNEKVIPDTVLSEIDKDIEKNISKEVNFDLIRSQETLLKNHFKTKKQNITISLF